MEDRALDRQGMDDSSIYHLGQQLRPRLPVHRTRRDLARHRPNRAWAAALQSWRGDGHVDERRSRRHLEARQATHARQPAQPHLCPPPAQCPPGFLRLVGRRQRAGGFRIPHLLHHPAWRPRLAPAISYDSGLRDARAGLVAVKCGKRSQSTARSRPNRLAVNYLPFTAENTTFVEWLWLMQAPRDYCGCQMNLERIARES